MLAQLAAQPDHVKDFLIIIGFILSAGASAAALLNQRRTQKREVTFGQEFVTRDFCQSMHTRDSGEVKRLVAEVEELKRDRVGVLAKVEEKIDKLRVEIKHDIQAAALTDESRISSVHDRINDVLSAVAKLEGRLEESRR
jgi:hypothetical protein